MLEKLGGRKLIASILVLAVGLVAVVVKGDIPQHFLSLLEFVFGGYALGNVASKAVNAAISVKHNTTPATPPAPPTPQSDYAPALENISNGVITVQKILEFIIQKTGLDKAPQQK